MEKLIITVAPTGSVPTKKMTPYIPIAPDEIIETAIRCESAGASIIHIHARAPEDESPSTDFSIFKQIVTGVRKQTNLIVQISTGARAGGKYEERSERLKLCPEMASLTTGSVNFPNSVYSNSPDLIAALAKDMLAYKIKPEMEIFDTSMINNALMLAREELAIFPLHFNFVMGLKGAIPATVENLTHLKNSIPAGSTWTASGIGKYQLIVNTYAILMGGHVRVGLEDNIYYIKGQLAGNEQMVERIVRLSREFGRQIAQPDEARKILGLNPVH